MNIHQEKLSQSVLSYGCCSKLTLEKREPHDLWQEYFRNEALMSAGWNAEAMEPDVYHKADDLNNDDDASLYGHGDDCVPRRERDEGAQSEHQSVDNHWPRS